MERLGGSHSVKRLEIFDEVRLIVKANIKIELIGFEVLLRKACI